jgi:four helix bundle protein
VAGGQLGNELKVRRFNDLIAWQKAMDLVEDVYRLTKLFPKDELFGLTSQLRRAAVSIPSNIAEGQSRRSSKEFIQFLSIAQGSLAEVETQVLIATRLQYISEDPSKVVLEKTAELGRILNGLMEAITNR